MLLAAGFLLADSDPLITLLLCSAWMVAWAAVAAAGGFKTLTGWFAFFPLFHFLLFALPLKLLFWEPAESRLRAPLSTSLVLLLFYVGLLLAVLAWRMTKVDTARLCSTDAKPAFFWWLAWICFILGTAAYFVAAVITPAGSDSSQGGLGFVSYIRQFKDFSIAAYVFYAWAAGKTLWKQPTFWFFLLVGVFLGVLTYTKTGTSQPIVFLLAAICCIFGLRSIKLLIGCAIFGIVFSWVVYPVMHYARGVKDISVVERLSMIGSIGQSYLTDSRFRSTVHNEVDDYADSRVITYLPDSVGVFDRFLMIGPTDLLVAGVDESGKKEKFHGFELFRLGLEVAIPRFLDPNKADVGSSEFLAGIAGTQNSVERTNPTWGVPAQLYYSFGFSGVLIGSFVVEFIFFLIINLCFGGRCRRSLWFCLAIVTLNMANSCSGVDALPILLLGVCVPAWALSKTATVLSARVRTRFSVA